MSADRDRGCRMLSTLLVNHRAQWQKLGSSVAALSAGTVEGQLAKAHSIYHPDPPEVNLKRYISERPSQINILNFTANRRNSMSALAA